MACVDAAMACVDVRCCERQAVVDARHRRNTSTHINARHCNRLTHTVNTHRGRSPSLMHAVDVRQRSTSTHAVPFCPRIPPTNVKPCL
jgi:hypothetical protein